MSGLLSASILGFIQGVSEFLPISSSGHLILVHEALTVNSANALAFDAVLQLATACAIIIYFRKDLWRLFQTFLRMVGRLPVGEKDRVLFFALMYGTIPAVVLGLLLESYMETIFRSPVLVAVVLVVGSALFVLAEYLASRSTVRKTLTPFHGFIIGLFQSLALVPGMSRSGASIAGGLILGFSRYESARFSFLLAIPIIVGSGGKKLIELLRTETSADLLPLAVASLVAFFVGLFAIRFMLSFVQKHTLWPFVWYRLALAGVVLAFVFLR